MIHFDIEAIRSEVRAMDFVRGTPEQVARWNEADENARANLAISDMALEPNEAALFKLLRDEAVPPDLAVQITLRLMDHPNADPALPITPADATR